MENPIRARYLSLEQQWRRRLDFLVVLAALATIPVIVFQENNTNDLAISICDWIIWAIFFGEFLFGLVVSQKRSKYILHQWMSVTVIIVSFPLLPDFLAYIRLARITRILRLLRIVSVTGRGLSAMRSSLATQGLMYVAGLTTLFTISAAALMTVIEGKTENWSFFDSLWWAVVTVTTVGYGDIAPASPMGRLLAVALMLCGLGLLSTLAAAISAYFVGSETDKDLSEIKNRLANIEQLINNSSNCSQPPQSEKPKKPVY